MDCLFLVCFLIGFIQLHLFSRTELRVALKFISEALLKSLTYTEITMPLSTLLTTKDGTLEKYRKMGVLQFDSMQAFIIGRDETEYKVSHSGHVHDYFRCLFYASP